MAERKGAEERPVVPRTSRRSSQKEVMAEVHVTAVIEDMEIEVIKESERPLMILHVGSQTTDQARAAEHRVLTRYLKKLQDRGWLTSREVEVLIVPARTLSHREAKREPLSVEESDKAIRVARLMDMALRIFGSKEKSQAWLRQQSPRFGDKSALELVKTEHGGRLVEEALIQIDEGMFA